MEGAMPEVSAKSRKSSVRKCRGGGRPAASKVAARMESLLDVATAVFLKHGYEHTSVSEIARRACASKGTIYARFPTKADLFAAVVSRKLLELRMSYAETLTLHASLKEVLEGYGDRLVRVMANGEINSLYKVFIEASLKFPKLAGNFWNVVHLQSMTVLRDYLVRLPEFNGEYPEHAAEMFWCLCCGQFTMRSLLQNDGKLTEAAIRFRVKEATRIFLSAYT